MMASDFIPPDQRTFPAWSRYASYVPLYGLGVPLVKLLGLVGQWPEPAIRAATRSMRDFGDYQATEHDVFACAGFKSGTTWVLQIAVQIAYRGNAEFDNIHSVVPWPDAPGPFQPYMIPLDDESPQKRSPTGLRVIKTHYAEEKVPYSPKARYIAVVRDPKDVIVSSYHFLRSMIYGPLMPPVKRWVEVFLQGALPQGSWSQHLASYWRVRDRSNVLFMTYEQMKQDSRGTVGKVAQFMGVELSPPEFEKVLQCSSFAHMKQHQSQFDPGQVVPWGGADYMLRQGRTGTSGELLTPALQRQIDDCCRAELKRLGCDFPYEQAFRCANQPL